MREANMNNSKFSITYAIKHYEHWPVLGLAVLSAINITGFILYHQYRAREQHLPKDDDLYCLYKDMDKRQRERARRRRQQRAERAETEDE